MAVAKIPGPAGRSARRTRTILSRDRTEDDEKFEHFVQRYQSIYVYSGLPMSSALCFRIGRQCIMH